MKYFGSTEDFKSRWYVHKALFNKRPANHTKLSTYIWKLKEKNKTLGSVYVSPVKDLFELSINQEIIEQHQELIIEKEELEMRLTPAIDNQRRYLKLGLANNIRDFPPAM